MNDQLNTFLSYPNWQLLILLLILITATVACAPIIESHYPAAGAEGEEIIVKGHRLTFGNPTSTRVEINELEQQVIKVTSNELSIQIAKHSTTGPITIHTHLGSGRSENVLDVLPELRIPTIPPPLKEIVPGRLRLELDKSLWLKEFPINDSENLPSGIERLKPSLQRVLNELGVMRVWRSMSMLERRIGNRYIVMSFPEWLLALQESCGKRKNAQEYTPPNLPRLAGQFELKFPDGIDLSAIQSILNEMNGVISVEVVVTPPILQPFFPNDPGWLNPNDLNYDRVLSNGRWGFHNTGADISPNHVEDIDIDAPEAWEFQHGSPEVVVAVLDNGIDVTHADLYLNIFLNEGEVPANIVSEYRNASPDDGLPTHLTFYDLNMPEVRTALESYGWTDTNGNDRIDGEDAVVWWSLDSNGDGNQDDDANGYADDLVGWNFRDGNNRPFHSGINFGRAHGTKTAGLIAAMANNNQHIAGVAHGVRILPVRSSFVLAEVIYALNFRSVKVINHSMASSFSAAHADIDAIFRTLEPEGVLYIASLGNTNKFYFGVEPSQREYVMSVTNFHPASYRNRYGSNSGYGPKTDVGAPASGISTLIPEDRSGWHNGTSAASAMTAGIAALVASENPLLTPEQIRQVLRMTAVDLPSVPEDNGENTSGWDLYAGWGLVNAGQAITALRKGQEFAEANILSLPRNYSNWHRNEEFSIQMGTIPIKTYLGIPQGEAVEWTLHRSSNWDMSNSVLESSMTGAQYSNSESAVHTINTDALDGRQVLELEVTTSQAVTSRERAVIDLPRAYIANFAHEQRIIESEPLVGFAYGPGFVGYRVYIAPGWEPQESDFTEVYSSTTEQPPHILSDAGSLIGNRPLMPMLDIFSLNVTLPPTGEATIRLVTEGARRWVFDEQVYIQNNQPPGQSGFPKELFQTATGSPTAVDLDGDGKLDLVTAGSGSNGMVKAFNSEGNNVQGFPVVLGRETIYNSLAAGDVDGDHRPELVLRTNPTRETNRIQVINHDGSFAGGNWPITINTPMRTYSPPDENHPVLVDVSLDGRLDILVSISQHLPEFDRSMVRAFQSDGEIIRDYLTPNTYEGLSPPAAGDIDGDDEVEIAAIAWNPRNTAVPSLLYVWNRDGTIAWTAQIIEESRGAWRDQLRAPVLADIDGDKRLEVITTVYGGSIRVFDDDGTLLMEKLRNTNETYFSPRLVPSQLQPLTTPTDVSLVFGDTDRNADNQIGDTYLHLIDSTSGADVTGWTNGVRNGDKYAVMEPIVVDFDEESGLEIIYGNGKNYVEGAEFNLSLYANNGSALNTDGQWPLYLPAQLNATPVVADLDNDTDLEIAVQTGGQNPKLYVFDLTASNDAGAIGWGQYGHNPRRTGNYHGDLQIVTPSTAHPRTVGIYNAVTPQDMLLINTRFSRGAPAQVLDTAFWNVTIGRERATVRNVRKTQSGFRIYTELPRQQTPGTYDLKVTFNDGGIQTWDAYQDAVYYRAPPQDYVRIGFDEFVEGNLSDVSLLDSPILSAGLMPPTTTSDAPRIESSNFGECQAFYSNNHLLNFDLDFVANKATFIYAELGGTGVLSINGNDHIFDDLINLDDVRGAGYRIKVVSELHDSNWLGYVVIDGAINALAIAGEELRIDGIAFATDHKNIPYRVLLDVRADTPSAGSPAIYNGFHDYLESNGYDVDVHESGELPASKLLNYDIFITRLHNHNPSPYYDPYFGYHPAEPDNVQAFVSNGGSVLFITEGGGPSHQAAQQLFLDKFNFETASDHVIDLNHSDYNGIWIWYDRGRNFGCHPATSGINKIYLRAAAPVSGIDVTPILYTDMDSTPAGEPVVLAKRYGAGRVVVSGDDFFSLSLDDAQNKDFALRLIDWIAYRRQ